MRKLIQASLLAVALTAPIYAGEMHQPIAPPTSGDAVASGYMPSGIIEIGSAILDAVLSLF